MKKFKTGVAMKVTQEQYENDLKKQLVYLGYNIREDWNKMYNPTINSDSAICCNILISQCGHLAFHNHDGSCHKIDNYNPELYLALAAMTEGNDWIVGEYLINKEGKNLFKCRALTGCNSLSGHASNNYKSLYRKATVGEIREHFNELEKKTPIEYKFKVGDKVKIIKKGCGCGPSTIGKVVTIVELGKYYSELGYKIKEKSLDTNSKYGNLIGEKSFEFIEKTKPDFVLSSYEATIIPYDKVEETLQMFRSKLEYGFDEEMEAFKEYKKNKHTIYLKYREGEYFIHYTPEDRTVIPNTIQYKKDIKQSYRDYFMSMPNWFKAVVEEEQSNQGNTPKYENAINDSNYLNDHGGGFYYTGSILGYPFWKDLSELYFAKKKPAKEILDHFIEQDKISMLRKVIYHTSPEYDYIVQRKEQLNRKKREQPVTPGGAVRAKNEKAYIIGFDPAGQSDRDTMFPVEKIKLRISQLKKKKLQGVQEIEEVSVPLYKKSKSRKF